VFLAAVITSHAQQFALESFTVDSGGGTSSGGGFTLIGTIGQADAAQPIAGGAFVFTGGFWGVVVAVPTLGAPELAITRNQNGSVTVSWASPSEAFALQRCDQLADGGWPPAPEPVADDGVRKSVTVAAPAGLRFYRLAQ
jgi:hypothetical protein